MENRQPLFSAKDITKSFSGTQALKGVDLEVYPGEIVGLVGENGAGKSTLLKIIIGAQPQSSGTMTMHGQPYAPRNPMDGNRAGIGMVFQEQSLIVNLNVAQNIFFGHEKNYRRYGFINWKQMNKDAEDVLANCDITNIPVRKKVIDLNFATRQMVEIAKVVNVARRDDGDGCLILLDEPTSVLNEEEVQTLFKQMRKLADKGHGVVFVSHRLDEVLRITDRIYVYKDGCSVGTIPTAEADEIKLYEMMVGRNSTHEYYQLEKQADPRQDVVLEVKNLSQFGVFKNIDFQLHKGEILGLCGVVGSGKEEICSVLCGDESPTSGQILLNGRQIKFSSPEMARKNGILMIPKERLYEGIVGMLSVEDNIALSNLEKLRKGIAVSPERITKQALKWIEKLNIKTSGEKALIMSLSGGNQQKVVFSRALASESDIIILNHPTRGVDVGAREEIYSLIREIVAQGKSVILLGDTLDECIGMSSRIIVLQDGLITAEFNAKPEAKPNQVDVVSHMM
ncbi:sugar ABC transporter ATP-binding protein [Butyricicoccus sp.]|uniref:sugar ABC transporter ATP-binding protein n=1 Tax=Butyricicoccus sp. TaxID=2049021 RepID=UPI003AAA8B55